MWSALLSVFLPVIFLGRTEVHALTSYANDFVDPDFVVARIFGQYTVAAQASILAWAKSLSRQGPWTVTSKTIEPPSNDIHDYMSWSPYWWPNCDNAGNTSALPPEEIWKQCTYVYHDGLFNPDARLINDVGNFQMLSDAVLYNAIAFALTSSGSSFYSMTAVNYIKTWFLDPATRMNPNLNFAQMKRGPQGQVGSHTGVLDLKGMTKITAGIMILRKTQCTDWTPDLDNQMIAWTQQYAQWLETNPTAILESLAPNNHGTFYYNQLASLKLLVNDYEGALNVTNAYFAHQFLTQINATGEQPYEAVRTRPYHYRAYNLAGMITNARIWAYTTGDNSVWNKTSAQGASIKNALDFAMGVPAVKSNEVAYTKELYPSIAAVAAIYGDPSGKYADFLANGFPGYASEAYFLWNQPLAGGMDESAAVLASLGITGTEGVAAATGTTQGTPRTTSRRRPWDKFSGAVRVHAGSWVLPALVIAGLLYTLCS
ncbi:putative alginate lyase [Lyophyllum shimeji]|uniref:Alginate lyase n=1 Tax=Lyophyllum shimeji TaxID=47721 RepID=A0A9P3PPU7_LYOSH|nr:putative alginate lyase [Lyophyllum shimeji]